MSRVKSRYIQWGTGSDEVNAQAMPASFTPSNFIPSQVASEGTNKVSAFLKGIDDKLGTLGGAKFVGNVTFDGIVSFMDVDVSASISDARLCLAQLLDSSDNYDRIYCNIQATSATNIRINNKLPAGTYRLVVIG